MYNKIDNNNSIIDIASDISDLLEVSSKTSSIVDKGIYVNNISDVINYLNTVIPLIEKLNISQSKKLISSLDEVRKELAKNKVLSTNLINPEKIFGPLNDKLDNILIYLKDVKAPIVNVAAPIINLEKQNFPDINIPTPIVNVPEAIINIPESPAPIVNIDLDKLNNSLREYLSNIIYNSEINPLAVRFSDGEKWVDELRVLTNKVAESTQYIPNAMFIKNPGGGISNPATEETLLQVLGKLSVRIDDISTSGVTYIGKAIIGSSTSSSAWQIIKIDETGTPITCSITYADGNANFDNIFDNRTSLTYS